MLSAILLASLAALAWAVFMYFLKPYAKLSFVRTPLRTLAYFIFATVFVAVAFMQASASLYGNATWASIGFTCIVLLYVNPWLYRFSRGEHAESASIHPDLELLRIDDRFLISKLGDVLFQQTVFGMLVIILRGLPLAALSLLLGILLALGHIGLVFRMPPRWSAYFIISAGIGGITLPWLILFVPGGFYYSVSFHMLWYVVSGIFHAKSESDRMRSKML